MVLDTSYRMLYILIEGDDDERFVKTILKPLFENSYNYLKPYKYAQKPKRKVVRFIRSIRSMRADFLCLADFDNSPCITHRKNKVRKEKIGKVEDSKIIIVKKAIESWYLAGMSDDCCKRLRIPILDTTDSVNTGQLRDLLARSKLGCTVSCKIEILRNYNLDVAKLKSQSFERFHCKYLS